MSQGKKQEQRPTPFILTRDVYVHIPKTHFYEQLAGLLDLSFVYELTRPLYAQKMGRPSLDPVVFFKCKGLVGSRFKRLRYHLINVPARLVQHARQCCVRYFQEATLSLIRYIRGEIAALAIASG